MWGPGHGASERGQHPKSRALGVGPVVRKWGRLLRPKPQVLGQWPGPEPWVQGQGAESQAQGARNGAPGAEPQAWGQWLGGRASGWDLGLVAWDRGLSVGPASLFINSLGKTCYLYHIIVV